MAGWHHQLNGYESAWTPGVGEDREAWRAAIHGVAKSWTQLRDWTELNWMLFKGLPWRLSSKESACNAGRTGSIPGWVRSPGEGSGSPLQYSCLGNPMDRGAWWATVHGVVKSQTWLSDWAHRQCYCVLSTCQVLCSVLYFRGSHQNMLRFKCRGWKEEWI